MHSSRVRVPVGMATEKTSGSDGVSGPAGAHTPPLASRVLSLRFKVFTASEAGLATNVKLH